MSHQKETLFDEVVRALLDVTNNLSVTELSRKTGLAMDRCEEIYNITSMFGNKHISVWSMDQERTVSVIREMNGKRVRIIYNVGNDRFSAFVESPSVLELMNAAETLIVQSKDFHHVFVEGFDDYFQYDEDGNFIFELVTGS